MVYKWQGFRYPVSADVAGKEFERIEKQNGSLTPENIVESARPESSKIHKLFEWDDSIAAESWRKQQARNVMSALVIVQDPETEHEQAVTFRAFVNVNDSAENGKYINLQAAMETAETKAVMLQNAKRELQIFKQKYEKLAELCGVFRAIDELDKG